MLIMLLLICHHLMVRTLLYMEEIKPLKISQIVAQRLEWLEEVFSEGIFTNGLLTSSAKLIKITYQSGLVEKWINHKSSQPEKRRC